MLGSSLRVSNATPRDSVNKTDDENRTYDLKTLIQDTLCKKNTGTDNSIEELSDVQTS